MSPGWQRSLGITLLLIGLVGLAGTPIDTRPGGSPAAPMMGPSFQGGAQEAACDPPTLPGSTVDVTLSDMGGGGMMSTGRMMSVTATPATVASGSVSFRVWNAGWLTHELVVLPLPSGGAGTRPISSDGTVGEEGSLGEASISCDQGTGEGITPGAASWMTLDLAPGRYELICNLPGHYGTGMFAELDVR